MLPGINHNIRYKDRLFHVQTEDRGLDQPLLTTHVFLEGSVIAEERSRYEDAIAGMEDREPRNQTIRALMQTQHKGCLKILVGGGYDDRISRFADGFSDTIEEMPAIPPPEEIIDFDIDDDDEELAALLDLFEAAEDGLSEQIDSTEPRDSEFPPSLPPVDRKSVFPDLPDDHHPVGDGLVARPSTDAMTYDPPTLPSFSTVPPPFTFGDKTETAPPPIFTADSPTNPAMPRASLFPDSPTNPALSQPPPPQSSAEWTLPPLPEPASETAPRWTQPPPLPKTAPPLPPLAPPASPLADPSPRTGRLGPIEHADSTPSRPFDPAPASFTARLLPDSSARPNNPARVAGARSARPLSGPPSPAPLFADSGSTRPLGDSTPSRPFTPAPPHATARTTRPIEASTARPSTDAMPPRPFTPGRPAPLFAEAGSTQPLDDLTPSQPFIPASSRPPLKPASRPSMPAAPSRAIVPPPMPPPAHDRAMTPAPVAGASSPFNGPTPDHTAPIVLLQTRRMAAVSQRPVSTPTVPTPIPDYAAASAADPTPSPRVQQNLRPSSVAPTQTPFASTQAPPVPSPLAATHSAPARSASTPPPASLTMDLIASPSPQHPRRPPIEAPSVRNRSGVNAPPSSSVQSIRPPSTSERSTIVPPSMQPPTSPRAADPTKLPSFEPKAPPRMSASNMMKAPPDVQPPDPDGRNKATNDLDSFILDFLSGDKRT